MDIFKDLPGNETGDDYVPFGRESIDRSFHTLDSSGHTQSPMKHELAYPQGQGQGQAMQNPIRNSQDGMDRDNRKSSCSPAAGNPILIPSRSSSTYRSTSMAASDTLWNQRSRQVSSQFSFRGSASMGSMWVLTRNGIRIVILALYPIPVKCPQYRILHPFPHPLRKTQPLLGG